MTCAICHCPNVDTIYTGKIRGGKYGNYTCEMVDVYQCTQCGIIFHLASETPKKDCYETDSYRQMFGEKASDYYSFHDNEVLPKLQYTGTAIFRDKIVADIGCGGGSFLDFVQGAAKKVIAVEPTRSFHPLLREKGYYTFAYSVQALEKFRNEVDVVTSFDVIEHVEHPLEFLRECYELCKSGGNIVIGTPSEQTITRQILGGVFDQFLFQTQHPWIFNEKSLRFMAEQAGFRNIEVKYKHRYGLGNLLAWLKYQKPMGNVSWDFVSNEMSAVWNAACESNGIADYLVLYAQK